MKIIMNYLQRVSRNSNILMILTSVHHVYGAQIYNTPWRLHVLIVSIPVLAITVLLTRKLQKATGLAFKYLFWLSWVIILLTSVFLGIYEGLYNHMLKNILFFSGLPGEWLNTMFPPPIYEMPNNAFFEITGVLQGVIAIPLIINFVRLTRLLFKFKFQIE